VGAPEIVGGGATEVVWLAVAVDAAVELGGGAGLGGATAALDGEVDEGAVEDAAELDRASLGETVGLLTGPRPRSRYVAKAATANRRAAPTTAWRARDRRGVG